MQQDIHIVIFFAIISPKTFMVKIIWNLLPCWMIMYVVKVWKKSSKAEDVFEKMNKWWNLLYVSTFLEINRFCDQWVNNPSTDNRSWSHRSISTTAYTQVWNQKNGPGMLCHIDVTRGSKGGHVPRFHLVILCFYESVSRTKYCCSLKVKNLYTKFWAGYATLLLWHNFENSRNVSYFEQCFLLIFL